jgi:peptidyl-prolyl cis-trans isomerase B (cyclophilin B)
VLVGASGCGDETGTEAEAPAAAPIPEASGPRDVAVIDVEDMGAIRVELLPEVAPQTVARFARLVREGYYDGTTFHRVVPESMIQGGDPNSRDRDPRNDGRGGREQEGALEPTDVAFVRGTVGMANRGSADTSGPQFFIAVEDSPDLDGRFSLFGHVVEGMDVVDAITRVPRDVDGRYGPADRPLEDVAMRIRLEEDAGGTAAHAASAEVADDEARSLADEEDDLGSGEWREGAP